MQVLKTNLFPNPGSNTTVSRPIKKQDMWPSLCCSLCHGCAKPFPTARPLATEIANPRSQFSDGLPHGAYNGSNEGHKFDLVCTAVLYMLLLCAWVLESGSEAEQSRAGQVG